MQLRISEIIRHFLTAVLTVAITGGCIRKAPEYVEKDGKPLRRIILQTDWYAQPEHGGFYHALVHGFYEEEGLDVVINQGGPNAAGPERVITNKAQFALHSSVEIMRLVEREIPFLIVGATMQQDPQALLLHADNPVERWEDLDNHTIMAGPGAAWLEALKLHYGITIHTSAVDYGLERFVGDKTFIQQCFVTNEPYYMAEQGVEVKTMLIADSGFSPYRVYYTSEIFARNYPELVRGFVHASTRGWDAFMNGDPRATEETLRYIGTLNPKMTPEFMAYVMRILREKKLVGGDRKKGQVLGLLHPERLDKQMEDMAQLKLLNAPLPLETYATTEFLPGPLRRLAAQPLSELSQEIIIPEGEPPTIAVSKSRKKTTDLGIIAPLPGVTYGEVRYIAYESLLSLPAQVIETDIVWLGENMNATVVYLEDLARALGVAGVTDLVIADCHDGYQSNFDRGVMKENRPFLVLEVGGNPPGVWGASESGRNYAYYVNLSNDEGVPDPGHKKPYGVYQLEFTRHDQKLKELYRGTLTNLEADARTGREIYLGSCYSCHQPISGAFGGRLSKRNLEVLAAHAKYNRAYFENWVRDPQAQSPGAAMGPHDYTEEQMNQLVDFLERVAAGALE